MPDSDTRRDQDAGQQQQRAREGEQVRRRVDEQEAQVAPAVAEARELRHAAARVVGDRQLADLELGLGRPDHHLGGELHAGGAQLERGQLVAAEGAHAAVGVAHAGAEEEVERAREHRVADVAVQPRHRAGLDPVHAVAHHEVGARLELGQEARDLAEVVGQVGVGHQDVAAAGGAEAGHVGVAVAAAALVDDAGAGGRSPARRCRRRSRCRRRRPRRRCRARPWWCGPRRRSARCSRPR